MQGNTVHVREKKSMLESEGIQFNGVTIANENFIMKHDELQQIGI